MSTMEQPHNVEGVPRPQSVYYDSAHGSPLPVMTGTNMPVVVEDDAISLAATASGHHSKREKLKMFAHQIKEVPHRMIMRADIITKAHPEMDADGREIPGITDSPAFNTAMIDAPPEHGTAATIALKPVHAIQNVGHFIAHPRSNATKTAAGQITAEENPYLDEGMDEELLEAHDKLEAATDARSNPAPIDVDNDELNHHLDVDEDTEVEEARDKIDELQTRREELRTAWITGKHVRRVKAVRLPMIAKQPSMDDYNEYDDIGNLVRWKWEMYAGQMTLYHTQAFVCRHTEDTNDVYFSRSELLRQAERLLVASAPFQQYMMHVHKVWLWEDWKLTTRWLVIWMGLIKTGYIVTFLYLYIAYIVIKNRFTKDNVRFLRETKERVESGGRPYKISELVSRHGEEGWVDPLLDEVGPMLQRQIGDIADYTEMLMNFYHWRNPAATSQSLILWVTLGLVAALVSTEYGAKMILFVAGMWFFCSRPVASKYPRWRKAVSLARMIHWDIPNNAELAFQGLEEDARKAMHRMGNDDVQLAEQGGGKVHAGPMPGVAVTNATVNNHARQNHSLETDTDEILAFRGTCGGQLGRLVLTPTTLRFVATAKLAPTTDSSTSNPAILFSQPYTSLSELRKTTSPVRKRQGALTAANNALSLLFVQAPSPARNTTAQASATSHAAATGNSSSPETTEMITITHMRKRDEAFNALLGFAGAAGIRWSVQQPLEGIRNGGGGVSEGSGVGGRRTEEETRTGKRSGRKEQGEGVHDGRGVLGDEGQVGDATEAGHETRMDKFKEKVRDVLHIDKSSEGDMSGSRKHESNVMQEATRI